MLKKTQNQTWPGMQIPEHIRSTPSRQYSQKVFITFQSGLYYLQRNAHIYDNTCLEYCISIVIAGDMSMQ